MLGIASSLEFLPGEDDGLIWQLHSSGVYLSQSLYVVINFRGVIPVYVPAIWKIMVPPRVHFFLWLLSKNKLLTRDNLDKRRNVEDKTCLFCTEMESVYRLFFDCVVARQAWIAVFEVTGFKIGIDFESMAKCWLCNSGFGVVNMLSLAICWAIWKLRNLLCFQDVAWGSMKLLWKLVIPMLKCWRVLTLVKTLPGLEAIISSLEVLAWCPEALTEPVRSSNPGGNVGAQDADGLCSVSVS
jgi:hypothetical protein